MKKLSWIVFDADDTLLDFQEAQNKAFYTMMEILEIKEDPQAFLGLYRKFNNELWRALEEGRISKEELIISRFKVFSDHVGMGSLQERMRLAYEEELAKNGDLIPGALELVQGLSRDFPLAIASNGILSIQKRRLAASGLDEFFKEVIISEETGFEKPQRGFFDVMMERIGEEDPRRILFVGDSLSSDMKGALAYGLRSCWYNPHNKTSELDIDYRVSSLEEVAELAGRLVI